jgi:LPS export ABC transporter protein LptC
MDNKILMSSALRGFVALVLLSAAQGCTAEDTTPVASPALLESGAESVIILLTQQISVNGVREGRVEADTAFVYPDSSTYSMRNSVLVLYNEQGVERARVVAKRGRFNYATKELIARGDVVLTIPDGNRRIETEELNYDPSGDRIWSDSMTVMREAGTVSQGMGFESDLEFRSLRVGPGSIRSTGGGTSP